ncbi:phosphatidylinositol-4-phosphate 5-kinase [Encephalitozoon cuniculi EcunIII-L]|uniref:Phosphatidylinositol-4-phosphate-5-kinase n=1 Tax=Encephalitozoon cuniculi TaxID=6035 RepID=M1K9X4_ENCCN|nr:phosphatidylinositol-4-phosphate-5-kinase [Encephalitozoon cuniculi]KMV66397.1 phosphatidylinositol-4-phosphate 5-kinase [Encephalitozoon cuniculi EcunIII-L]UYI28023.1 phosphatidylinositol-4-phosphate-5-kinase [Encephalitozoon cuniculi]
MDDQKIDLMLESLSRIEEMMITKPDTSDVEELGEGSETAVRAYNHKEFREIRALSGIGGLHRLGKQYILNEQIHGKSGSFLFFTRDFKFIVKTIRKNEFRCIRGMINEYKVYVLENPMSFLCKILGCYSLCSRSNEEYFIVMESMLEGPGVQEIYDLKGMSVKRKGYSMSSLKEMDWIRNSKKIDLGKQKEAVISQIESDVQFLRRHRIMDYSFLVCFKSEREEASVPLLQDNHHSRMSGDKAVRFGIVDILTQWTFTKRMERMLHILCCKLNSSCLNPDAYMDRFLVMVESDLFK